LAAYAAISAGCSACHVLTRLALWFFAHCLLQCCRLASPAPVTGNGLPQWRQFRSLVTAHSARLAQLLEQNFRVDR